MIDHLIYPVQRRALQPIATRLARVVRADHITIAGFLIGLLAVPALATENYMIALLLILFNRALDGFDGAVARINGATDRGAFLDIALDFFFYAALPFGFALANPEQNALPAAFLLLGFMGTGSSFLAFSTIAAQRGMRAEDYPTKGIYYLGGLTEGFETIVFFVIVTALPNLFPIGAYIFGTLCFITTLTRWLQAWQSFKS